ncbi:MAG: isochorismate synthase [Calditrichaeota bacterium]|nr:isochorismate synthase [Calditrichota bacterium]
MNENISGLLSTAKDRLADKLSLFLTESSLDHRFIRLQVSIDGLDIIQWLRQQSFEIKTYWRDREGKFEMAGLGEADIISGSLMPDYHALFSRLKEYLGDTVEDVRYYGGMRFNRRHNSDFKWQAFTSYRFIVPKFELFRKGTETYFICNLLVHTGEEVSKIVETALNELKEIQFNQAAQSHDFPKVTNRIDFPDFDGWKNNIEEALTAFHETNLDKIVLARKTTLKFGESIDPIELLWRLRLNNHRAYYFCFQPKKDVAFIGGTPEQLYCRHENQIHTEAVAGTRKRGTTTNEDIKFENDLLNCEKDIREHRFVVDSIRGALKKLCTNIIEQEKLSILKLSRLQHLLMQFSGKIKDDVQDCDILENLHPTPAVGGVPSQKSISEIERIEQFDRGWYAGPVGWIGKDKAEFAVAIRSGLVHEDELYLYSGAGIVEGSDSQSEWEEIETKISGFMNALKEIDQPQTVKTDSGLHVTR